METISSNKSFGGIQGIYRHESHSVNTPMRFSVYVPPQAEAGDKVPVIWWLSGLTSTEENFTIKGGFQRHAAEHGVIVVAPDTSPRGAGIAGEDEAYDFGTGAGFYVDATVAPWSGHYRMFSYVSEELPALVAAHFPADMSQQGIMGFSMGGHGAMLLALRNPGRYRAVSAFAPICHLSACDWGHKALSGYLGDDRTAWRDWDVVELIKSGKSCPPLLVDQGTADEFLAAGQLQPQTLRAACDTTGQALTLGLQEGYDHSYYFVASFIGEHIAHHARAFSGGGA